MKNKYIYRERSGNNEGSDYDNNTLESLHVSVVAVKLNIKEITKHIIQKEYF